MFFSLKNKTAKINCLAAVESVRMVKKKRFQAEYIKFILFILLIY